MNSIIKNWRQLELVTSICSSVLFPIPVSHATISKAPFSQPTRSIGESADENNSLWRLEFQRPVRLTEALAQITQTGATSIVLIAEIEGEEFTFGVSIGDSRVVNGLGTNFLDKVQRISGSVSNAYSGSSSPQLVKLGSTYNALATKAKAGDLDLQVSTLEGRGATPTPKISQILSLDSNNASMPNANQDPMLAPTVSAEVALVSQWWPTGNATVGNDPYGCYRANGQFVSKCRYFTQNFKWSADRLAKLKSYGSNLTYEPDLHTYNYDDLHYAGAEISWTSNLPRAYMDTRLDDTADEIAYTVGSADATLLASEKTYVTHISADWGNASIDKAKISHQGGYRAPSDCYSTFCVFANETKTTVPFTAFNIPGSVSWTN